MQGLSSGLRSYALVCAHARMRSQSKMYGRRPIQNVLGNLLVKSLVFCRCPSFLGNCHPWPPWAIAVLLLWQLPSRQAGLLRAAAATPSPNDRRPRTGPANTPSTRPNPNTCPSSTHRWRCSLQLTQSSMISRSHSYRSVRVVVKRPCLERTVAISRSFSSGRVC